MSFVASDKFFSLFVHYATYVNKQLHETNRGGISYKSSTIEMGE